MEQLCRDVEEMCGFRAGFYNSINFNAYFSGDQSLDWHADDEPLMGNIQEDDICITSMSLGVPRVFVLRHKATGSFQKVWLNSGDILTMEGRIQKHYLHKVFPLRPLIFTKNTVAYDLM